MWKKEKRKKEKEKRRKTKKEAQFLAGGVTPNEIRSCQCGTCPFSTVRLLLQRTGVCFLTLTVAASCTSPHLLMQLFIAAKRTSAAADPRLWPEAISHYTTFVLWTPTHHI